MNVRARHPSTTSAGLFTHIRDLVLSGDHEAASDLARSPALERFNWATDWFDSLSTRPHPALLVPEGEGWRAISFDEIRVGSNRVANLLVDLGARRGDRVFIVLDNGEDLYRSLLACLKAGLVAVPAFLSLTAENLIDRIARCEARFVVAAPEVARRIALERIDCVALCAGEAPPGWLDLHDAGRQPEHFEPSPDLRIDDPAFAHFTSGTTSAPKLAVHSGRSYPVGHLSSLAWNGVRRGDVHLDVSAPSWAKHSWSSFFVPWTGEATVVALPAAFSDPSSTLKALRDLRTTSFCAPPSVWRALAMAGLGAKPSALREVTSAGEPLAPSLATTVLDAWGLQIRNGYGQTEATAMVGFAPGVAVKPGALGYPLPGYDVVLVDPERGLSTDGEICLPLGDRRPVGLMLGYGTGAWVDGSGVAGEYYRTGDLARRDGDGCLWYVGRLDDQFKSYDHRISPAELEAALLGEVGILEAAVIPHPDPIGLWVPKAVVVVARDARPDENWAAAIFANLRAKLPPEFAVRRLAVVSELPKTPSGKVIRRALRQAVPALRAEFTDVDPPAAAERGRLVPTPVHSRPTGQPLRSEETSS